MDIRSMQYFLAVIREGTISAAAESLHVAQPSLSRQMKDLEEELGVTLFERGNRRITLTEEGQVLRRRAEELVRLMQLTQEETALFEAGTPAQLQIRCFGGVYNAPGSAVYSVDVWPALDDRILGGE